MSGAVCRIQLKLKCIQTEPCFFVLHDCSNRRRSAPSAHNLRRTHIKSVASLSLCLQRPERVPPHHDHHEISERKPPCSSDTFRLQSRSMAGLRRVDVQETLTRCCVAAVLMIAPLVSVTGAITSPGPATAPAPATTVQVQPGRRCLAPPGQCHPARSWLAVLAPAAWAVAPSAPIRSSPHQ